MTNEELVTAIQAGERDRMGELWEQVERFACQQANRLWRSVGPIPGTEPEDLYQSGYIALCAAVETYDPARGMSFIGWLALALKTAFSETCGYRTSRRDPLNRAGSLDAPISEDEDGAALGDLIRDPHAEDAFTAAEEELYREQLHRALEATIDRLSPEAAAVIRGVYWNGETLAEIGRRQGISIARAGQIKSRALSDMAKEARKSKAALRQFVEQRTPYYAHKGVKSFNRDHTSVTEYAVLYREYLLDRSAQGTPQDA